MRFDFVCNHSKSLRAIGFSVLLAFATEQVAASCPASNSLGNFQSSNLVGATSEQNGNDITYYFDSFVDRNPTDGVPGLIEYCVYPQVLPNSVTAAVSGWQAGTGVGSFSFSRPNGNPTNIPLDGTQNIEMGTASWASAPASDQMILLHINDADECNRIYGGNPGTCFVFPGSMQQAQDLTVSKTATTSYIRTYKWDVEKNVDKTHVDIADGDFATFNYTVDVTHDAGVDSNWTVYGQITVNNPNNFDVLGVQVSDATDGASCTVFDVDNVSVPANGAKEVGYLCSFSQMPAYNTDFTNTATITWPDIHSPNMTASGSHDYSFGEPTSIVQGTVDVKDSLAGDLGQASYTDPNPIEFTYSETFAGVAGTCTPYINTASVSSGPSDSQTVTVCVGSDLTLEKTATPSYDLTYDWDIKKAVVGATKMIVDQGYPATFNYTVTVGHDNGTASNWQVSGVIKASNPNDWEVITAAIQDQIPGATCVLSQGSVTVPAEGSFDVAYTCTFTSNPTAGTNTATAIWDAEASHTPNGSATATKDFAFGDPTHLIDECVVVSDDRVGQLGTLCVATSLNPSVYSYSLTFTGPKAGSCVDYSNTATVTTQDQHIRDSSSATVTVCSYAAALTPGYWKNHLAKTGTTGCIKLPSGTSCNNNGPFALSYLPLNLGNFSVSNITIAAQVFVGMNCSSSKDQDAVGCLAGHLLASKLNVANGANPCIQPTITSANQFLINIGYTGPTGKYTLTAAQRSQAISLKSALDAYNNGTGCH